MKIVEFFISTTLGKAIGILILAGGLIWYYGSIKWDDGYTRGAADSTEAWSGKYQMLVDAKVTTDSLLTIARETLPLIVLRYRDRTLPSPDIRAQVDSAFREGIAQGLDCQEQLYHMAEPATLWIDTTQLTRDSLEVRTTGRVDYYPLFRDFYATIQAAPVITRTWLVTRGYIIQAPPDIWGAEITLGSRIKNPSLRLGFMVFRETYGLGLDLQSKENPVFKIGVRF